MGKTLKSEKESEWEPDRRRKLEEENDLEAWPT